MNRKILGLLAMALVVGGPATANAQGWTITATGTIYADTGVTGSLFAPMGTSLVGDAYTETITTNLLLNGQVSGCSISCAGTFGGSSIGLTAAPYTLTMTVNGVTYTQTESSPSSNYGFIVDALTINDTRIPPPQDLVEQLVSSSGCNTPYHTCTDSDITAYSTTRPFVPNLNFNHQSITASSGLDSGSNAYFLYQRAGDAGPSELLNGSIKTLTVSAVNAPEVDERAMASGLTLLLGSLAVLRGRRREAATPTQQRWQPLEFASYRRRPSPARARDPAAQIAFPASPNPSTAVRPAIR
jgi:hypothetical protein